MNATPARLIVLNTFLKGKSFDIVGDGVVLGRSSDCHLALEHPSVSRVHAELTFDGTSYVIRDNDSRNGTSVNGERITSKSLAHGDTVAVGDVQCRFLSPNMAEEWRPVTIPEKMAPELNSDDVAQGEGDSEQPERALTIADLGIPVEGMPVSDNEAKSGDKQPVVSQSSLLYVILSIGIVMGVILLVISLLPGADEAARTDVLVEAGSTRPIAVLRYTGIQVGDESIAEVSKDPSSGGYVLVKGKLPGYTTATVLGESGRKQVLHIVVVLPALDEGSVDSRYLIRSERLAKANSLISAAEALEAAEAWYRAGEKYREVIELLNPLSQRPKAFADAKAGEKRTTRKVTSHYSKLRDEFHTARKRNDRGYAKWALQQIVELIPDESDDRHIKAQGILSHFRMEELERRKK